MNVYVLDSDHVSLHQRGHPGIVSHVRGVPAESVFSTVITFEEQMRGWLAVIRRAREPDDLARAYQRILAAHTYFCQVALLPFSETAASEFYALRQAGARIGTQDLRIAAIARTSGGTLVTRNRSDFSRVPGLTLADWATV